LESRRNRIDREREWEKKLEPNVNEKGGEGTIKEK